MHLSQKEYSAQIYRRLLTPSMFVSLFFVILLLRSAGGFQVLFSSNDGILFFAIMLITGMFTFWLQRQTDQKQLLLTFIEPVILNDKRFQITVVLLVLAISSGVNFLLLPAYHAYQILVAIPRLFPLIAPFVGWLTTQIVLLYLLVLVIHVANSEPSTPSTRSLVSYLWLSLGSMLLFLYLNSIFIVWFELRGFKLF